MTACCSPPAHSLVPPRPGAALGWPERTFTERRHTAYLATVTATGWPYVQLLQGPPGFLRTLDARTLGCAIRSDAALEGVENGARVSLIVSDTARRKRLTVLATATVCPAEERPDLVAKLEAPTFQAGVSHVLLLRVEGFSWDQPARSAQRPLRRA